MPLYASGKKILLHYLEHHHSLQQQLSIYPTAWFNLYSFDILSSHGCGHDHCNSVFNLTMPYSRHDLSSPAYGLQHGKKLFWIMIPRKRVEKKNQTFVPRFQLHSWDMETSLGMVDPSIVSVYYLEGSELERDIQVRKASSLSLHPWLSSEVCHPLVSSAGLLSAIAYEIYPFGQQHQEQGLPACISIGTSLWNSMWVKFSPFLTLKCFGSVSLFIHALLPLCWEQAMVESGIIQAPVAW